MVAYTEANGVQKNGTLWLSHDILNTLYKHRPWTTSSRSRPNKNVSFPRCSLNKEILIK